MSLISLLVISLSLSLSPPPSLPPSGTRLQKKRKMSEIKNHPYFSSTYKDISNLHKGPALRVPSLRDLCIRAVAELAIETSLDFDSPKPGQGGPTDLLRMNTHDREMCMHFLDRIDKLSEPRVLRRFYESSVQAKTSRMRPQTHDFLGLTSEREVMFHEPMSFIQITSTTDIAELTSIVKIVNRERPKFAVFTGKVEDPQCRKICSKISETVNVIMADGRDFFVFYSGGVHGIVVRGELVLKPGIDAASHGEMMQFLSQELEQSRVCQHHTFVFVDVDVRRLPKTFVEKVSKSRVCALIGSSEAGSGISGLENAPEEYLSNFVLKQETNQEDVLPERQNEKENKEDSVYPQEEDSDVDSDGYNMVDDDSEVQLISQRPGTANVILLDHEVQWRMDELEVSNF